ncbi:MAG: GAF domain-containing protein [Chloroflexi bacterium]|nr:GAF domain-containing protein [Chloroflexota bacterium]
MKTFSWFLHSVVGRVTFAAVLGSLTLLGLLGYIGLAAVRESTELALAERLNLAQATAEQVEQHLLQEVVGEMAQWVPNIDPQGEKEDQKRALGRLFSTPHSGFAPRALFLLDKQGDLVWAEPSGPWSVTEAQYKGDHVIRAMTTGQPRVSNLITGDTPSSHIISVVVPLKNDGGEVVGALGSILNPEEIASTLSVQFIAAQGKERYGQLVDQNGHALASSREIDTFQKVDHADRIANLMAEGKAKVTTCHSCHGPDLLKGRVREVAAFAPLSVAPWGVIIRQTEAEALAPSRQLQRLLLIVSVGMVVAVALAMWPLSRSMVAPLRALSGASRRMARGDLEVAVPISGPAEVRELALDFEAMREKLKASLEEVRSINQELEERVKLRTTELERRTQELEAVYSVVAMSQHLSVQEILDSALARVLDILALKAGWIMLRDGEKARLKPMAWRGISPEAVMEEVDGHGDVAARAGAKLLHLRPETPLFAAGVSCFLSVPLGIREQALGVLNIACRDDCSFTEEELRLLNSIGQQLGVAVDNARLYRELQQKEELRGQLLGQTIAAQEEERRRIARELHDSLAQIVTGLTINLEALAKTAPETTKEGIDKSRAAAASALDELRRLIVELRPSVLDDLGLVPAIRWYAEKRLLESGVAVEFSAAGFEKRLPGELETTIFRTLQEAINNVAKHAQARQAKIALRVYDSMVQVTVEDDGRGFDTQVMNISPIVTGHWGLVGMKERVALLGGTVTIWSQPGRGTKVTLDIPIEYK